MSYIVQYCLVFYCSYNFLDNEQINGNTFINNIFSNKIIKYIHFQLVFFIFLFIFQVVM